jgi:hypothetical protein
MKKDQELTVVTKTYDLILWSCNHTSKFPRNHRFVLGERIERNLYDLLETLIRAKYTKNRQQLLEEANLNLEVLRFQMRLAKDLQCLKVESYAFNGFRPSSTWQQDVYPVPPEFERFFPLGECSQVQVAVPCWATSVARTNEAQARRVW